MEKQGFPPIVNKKSRILILGSMPGEESIRLNQYYAYKRNAFWKIMGNLFVFPEDTPYKQKTKILLSNRIAVWDVISQCRRKGSLDSSIESKSISVNDFASFYTDYPGIRYVFFNGQTAQKEYTKRILPLINRHSNQLTYTLMPSTSPANARLSSDEKLKLWAQLLSVVNQ